MELNENVRAHQKLIEAEERKGLPRPVSHKKFNASSGLDWCLVCTYQTLPTSA
jgi:hypothetical protein